VFHSPVIHTVATRWDWWCFRFNGWKSPSIWSMDCFGAVWNKSEYQRGRRSSLPIHVTRLHAMDWCHVLQFGLPHDRSHQLIAKGVSYIKLLEHIDCLQEQNFTHVDLSVALRLFYNNANTFQSKLIYVSMLELWKDSRHKRWKAISNCFTDNWTSVRLCYHSATIIKGTARQDLKCCSFTKAVN